jgi:hypothetical protein
MLKISRAERQFLEHGVLQGVRADGRSNLDYRHFVLETGILSHTNGSARLKLSGTDIIVGVKLEVGEPEAEVSGEMPVILKSMRINCRFDRRYNRLYFIRLSIVQVLLLLLDCFLFSHQTTVLCISQWKSLRALLQNSKVVWQSH